MKKLVLGLVTILGAGCGITEDVNRRCEGSDLEIVCTYAFGRTDRDQGAAIENLDSRLSLLEDQVSVNITNINSLSTSLQSTQFAVSVLETSSSQYATDIALLNSQIATLQSLINNIQTQTNNNIVQLTQIQNSDAITEIIDVCGDGPGYDEVVLRSSNGKLMAYFESGTRRFLSLLPQGFYSTTDNTSCGFQVMANGNVCWGAGYATCK